MSMTAIRRALRPRRILWHNLLVSLAAVVTIVVGLLAMHSLNLEHSGSASAVSSTTAASHHNATMVAGEEAGSATDACGGAPCAPEHSMTVMACILALLVSLLLVGAIRVVTAWTPVRKRTAAVVAQWASLPLPSPPSLHALCISRT